jgi:hypothetical protein
MNVRNWLRLREKSGVMMARRIEACHIVPRSFVSTMLLCALLSSGCSSLGPGRVPSDRFDYSDAIARSAKEQMLANIVRMRYVEFPTFLSVSSVITTYTYEGTVGVAGTAGLPGADTVGGSANLRFSERPTITYTPLAGQEFIRRLVNPISAEGIFGLAHAGWAADLLMLSGVHRMNDIENMTFASVPPPGRVDFERQEAREIEKLREFHRLIDLILSLTDKEVIEVQATTEKKGLPSLVFVEDVAAADRPLVEELRSMLELDPELRVFRFTTRLQGRARDEITIQTRSLMSIMGFVAKGVELPPAHVEAGWAREFPAQYWEGPRPAVPLRVRSQAEQPLDAFVAVRYLDAWFYIDRADLDSKRMFAMLLGLFELQAPASSGAAPMLTLPTGG